MRKNSFVKDQVLGKESMEQIISSSAILNKEQKQNNSAQHRLTTTGHSRANKNILNGNQLAKIAMIVRRRRDA